MIATAVVVQEMCMVVSTSKTRIKHTLSPTIRRKIQINTKYNDVNDDDRGNVEGVPVLVG